MANIRTYDTTTALLMGAAEYLVELAEKYIQETGRFSVALAGGGTPRPMYEALATEPLKSRVNWGNVHVFWGDERCVPPAHDDSNYKMANEALLKHVPIPANQVYRIQGEMAPEEAAAKYERVLRDFFNGRPRFDLALFGMGNDGHTLSLFPGTTAIHEKSKWVVGHHITGRDMWRITLTPPAVNNSNHLAFLVGGKNKAESLKQVLQGAHNPDVYPSQMIQPEHGEIVWFVDKDAAVLL